MDDSNPINEEHSFTEFLETIKEPPAVDENGDEVDDTIPELPSTQNCPDDVVCAVCGWRPRPSCKDKHRALQRHMREKHGQRSNLATKKPLPVVLDEVEKVNVLDEDDEKQKLVSDLDLLQHKFPDLYKVPPYSYPETPIHTLRRYKSTFQRMIGDKISGGVAFNCLVMLGRGAEQTTGYLGLCDLDGYASDLVERQAEIMEILQECIDTNVIDVSSITPEIKLALLLFNIGAHRVGENKKKSAVPVDIGRVEAPPSENII